MQKAVVLTVQLVSLTCILPDGRSIPAGQDFKYEHVGVSLVCTCPHKPSGGKLQVQCRRDNEGKNIYANYSSGGSC